jgi:uncharacterized membrane protein (DUF106 family)
MPIWLPYLSTIIGALVQLAKLLIDMARDKEGDQIKECGLAIEEARKSGDVSKLTKIIENMKRGKSCE